jgi:glycerophosphoryl diester phosphodiesterase
MKRSRTTIKLAGMAGGMRWVVVALIVTLTGAACTSPADAPPAEAPPGTGAAAGPIVIGHRGASGYRPEHTLASYELAARMGADFIEPDLVPTKDGVLVTRHEPEIGGTTDVARHPEFAARRTTKTVDGQALTGWFTSDFTLDELRTLRATERIPDVRQRNTIYNGRYPIPTFQEVIDLAKRLSAELRRPIGIYPETKHPTYFRNLGLPIEPRLVDALNRNDLNRPDAHVYVQSFETGNLRALREQLKVPLIQLIDSEGAPADLVAAGDRRTYADLVTPAGLAEIARYARGIGPAKTWIVPTDAAGAPGPATTLVTDAHRAGLLVHPFTFRNENQFLPADLRSSADPHAYGDAITEDLRFLRLGVDGLFSDNSDTAVEARTQFRTEPGH